MTENVGKSRNIKIPHRLHPKIRAEKVFELTTKGYTINTIAQLLNVSDKTIERDKEKIKKREIEHIEKLRKKLKPEVQLLKRIKDIEEIRRHLWQAFSEQKRDRVSISRELRKLDELEMEHYVKLRWLPGKAETTKIINEMGKTQEEDVMKITRE